MDKKIIIITIASLLLILVVGVANADAPWTVMGSGNGTVSGRYLPNYNVVESEIGWNFKWDSSTGKVKGQLNIVEKLADGKVRHFKLYGYQVDPVGDPSEPWILFNCKNDTIWARSIRVEGADTEGNIIAAHFRDSASWWAPNSAWYWVKDSSGAYITETRGPLTVSVPFTMKCR